MKAARHDYEPQVSTAPLRRALEDIGGPWWASAPGELGRGRTNPHGSGREAVRLYAERYGCSERTARAHWARLQDPTASLYVVDRWACLADLCTPFLYIGERAA